MQATAKKREDQVQPCAARCVYSIGNIGKCVEVQQGTFTLGGRGVLERLSRISGKEMQRVTAVSVCVCVCDMLALLDKRQYNYAR